MNFLRYGTNLLQQATPTTHAVSRAGRNLNTSYEQDQELASHRLVLYSSDDPRKKANAALLMALYIVRTCYFSVNVTNGMNPR